MLGWTQRTLILGRYVLRAIFRPRSIGVLPGGDLPLGALLVVGPLLGLAAPPQKALSQHVVESRIMGLARKVSVAKWGNRR
jgi:hypothetical protein